MAPTSPREFADRRRSPLRVVGIALLSILLAGGATIFSSLASPVAATSLTFNPVSVTFISPSTGWALGFTRCSSTHRCFALRKTVNAGGSWTNVALSASLLGDADRVDPANHGSNATTTLNVRFANPRDGWIYGSVIITMGDASPAGTMVTKLWSTHDGGRTWTAQNISAMGMTYAVLDLGVSRGVVHAVGFGSSNSNVVIRSSPVGVDRWRRTNTATMWTPAGGSQIEGGFTFSGTRGWVIVGNDRGATSGATLSAKGQWVPWKLPCESVGGSYVVPAALNSRDLTALCTMGGFAYSLSKSAPPGAKLGSLWLYTSRNGGATFNAVSRIGSGKYNYLNPLPGIPSSPAPGTVLIDVPSQSGSPELLESFNSGSTWTVVYRGELTSLHFITASRGVGIVQTTPDSYSMIVTGDGGRHWRTATM